MDPQACLARLIAAVAVLRTPGKPSDEMDGAWSELGDAFDDLAAWLRGGGFPPVACGPIFGTGPVHVGYPGMMLGHPPRVEQRPIVHVRSAVSNWRYAIMRASHTRLDGPWVLREYHPHTGAEVAAWCLPGTESGVSAC